MWREYNTVNIVQKKSLTQNRINLLVHAFILLYFLITDIYVAPSFSLTWQYLLITYHVSDWGQVIWKRVAAAWALGAYKLVGGGWVRKSLRKGKWKKDQDHHKWRKQKAVWESDKQGLVSIRGIWKSDYKNVKKTAIRSWWAASLEASAKALRW